MIESLLFTTGTPEETIALGAALGGVLAGGEFVALTGPLGAGKTQFVKGLARGLGVPDDEPIISPTFVLVREYAGRLRLFHLDLYRLRGDIELADLGVDEMLHSGEAVVAAEWADRAPAATPTEAWRIAFEHAGADRRSISISHPAIQRLRLAIR